MFSIKSFFSHKVVALLVAGFTAAIGTSCTPGLQSGSIDSIFSGVQAGKALSPTAIQLDWIKSADYTEYKIYVSYQQDPLATSIFATQTIENLTPGTTYRFKVVATGTAGSSGGDIEYSVPTWDRFQGIANVFKDADGHLVVSWTYPNQVEEYQIFYNAGSAPTAATTNNWTTPNVTTRDTQYIFKNLTGSTTYYFTVHAKYRQGEYERPDKVLASDTSSSFPAPFYELPKITIGSLPTITVTPVITDEFPAANYLSQAFKGGSAISDPVRGAGKATFSSTIPLALGKVDDISLKVNFTNSKINETLTISGLSTYLKGVVPYVDTPPIQDGLGPAFLGRATAVGDYNCDGYDDLAVGMPYASLSQFGINTSQAGAVIIYYGGYTAGSKKTLKMSPAPTLDPALPGKDPQILTFPDLSYHAQFGYSLASRGNLNGDKAGDYTCDDLAVGAPGQSSPDGRDTGNVFLFFGTSQVGLKAPATVATFSQNQESCDGREEGATCAAVRLWPNYSLWPSTAWGGSAYVPSYDANGVDSIRWGAAVSFVGDYNADGYEDLAIGAPNASWDGVSATYANDSGWNPNNVGYVAMYFGSPFGLGQAEVKPGQKFRWIKIYPSVVQSNMRFGTSISAGDVDGRHRILYGDSSSSQYVGGSDMVIGAPGFAYTNPDNTVFPMTSGAPADNVSITPIDGGWWGTSPTTNAAAGNNPRYGFTQYNNSSGTGQGIAFVYFGRSSTSKQTTPGRNNPDVPTFWGCGVRGMNAANRHFSCLANSGSDQARVVFPRDNGSRGFGTSLRVLGDKSARDSNDDLKCLTSDTSGANKPTVMAAGPCRDPNGDGFAEILVAAPNSSPTGHTDSGVIWEFFGNYDRLYEAGATDNFRGTGTTFFNTAATCQNFALGNYPSNSAAFAEDKMACRPTRILPNSIPDAAALGAFQGSLAVGDVTQDGLMDLAVGSPSDTTRGSNAGSAYIFTSLRGAGLTTTFKKVLRNATNDDDLFGYATSIGDFDPTEQNHAKDYYIADSMGTGVTSAWTASANRLTSLPLNDLAVGSPNEDSNRPAGGGLHLFYSGNSTLGGVVTTSDADIYDTLASLQDFGYGETRLVGDINGDGYDDAISHIQGYNSAGNVTYDAIVYYGSSIGLVTTQFCLTNASRVFKAGTGSTECYPSRTHATNITKSDVVLPQKLIRPNNVSARWGDIGFSVGDVNNDGFSDIALIDNGQVLVYYGTRGGLQDIVIPSYRPATNDPQIVTTQVSTARSNDDSNSDRKDTFYQKANPVVSGDFNGDGYSDFAISNPQAEGQSLSSYTTAVDPITGKTETISDVSGWPVDSVHTATNGSNMLWRCSAASGLSGACTSGSNIYQHGLVYIFYGSPNGVASPAMYTAGTGSTDIKSPGVLIDYVYNTEDTFGAPIEANAKTTCTSLSPANGCIPAVTILRNPVIYNIKNGYNSLSHMFGSSLTVMKINNSDTFDTLLVSSPGYEHPDCYNYADPSASATELNQGRIFVFRGSKFGLLAGAKTDYYPAPLVNSSARCQNMPQAEDKGLGIDAFNRLRALRMTIVSPSGAANNRYRQWGLRMTNAGDINGDGFEDLVVTAPYENVPDQNGTAVTGAGAGYVIYGPLCSTDNDQAVQNYFEDPSRLNVQQKYSDVVAATGVQLAGPCSGKNLAPQKFRAKDISVAESTNRRYGFSISGSRTKKGEYRGDINLDKFSDVVFASPYWNDSVAGKSNVGRGIVLFGSPSGLFTDDYPSSVVEPLSMNRTKPYILLPPTSVTNAAFFEGNVTTGDVNGDHSMDLMVPSYGYDSTGGLTGIDLGTFFLFY